jgi:hypothetical protein
METVLYRNRIYRHRLVEAVQYTCDNDREMFEWVPGKQFIGPHPSFAVEGLTVFTPEGRRKAVWGDWVYRDQGTDRFWVGGPDAFEDSYEPVGGNA